MVLLLDGPPEVDIHTTGIWLLDTPVPGQRTTMAIDDHATHVAGTARHLVPIDLRSRTAELVVEVTVDVVGNIITENGATPAHLEPPRQGDLRRTTTWTCECPRRTAVHTAHPACSATMA